MAVGGWDRGPLWVDGRMTLRVRGPGPEPGRVVRVRRPFAMVGRLPGADVRIDDPAVDLRHAFLLLDGRGLFGVDLRTAAGTRFAGEAAASARLGAGDVIEVAGRRIEVLRLRVGGSDLDGPPSDDDPLADADPSAVAALALDPLDAPGPPWMLGSSLAFVGRGEACAIRIEGASASEVHCALLRGPAGACVIDLLGRLTRLNDRPVDGASRLFGGDVLTLGQARFAVRVELPLVAAAPGAIEGGRGLARAIDAPGLPAIPGEGDHGSRPAMLLAGSPLEARGEVLETLRLFQADAATLFEAQIGRLEALSREVAALRDEVRGRGGVPAPVAGPLRLELPPRTPAESDESAAWLLERLNGLESEGRSTWKDLIGRIASSVRFRDPSGPTPGDRS